jgi:mRNA interferase HigB
MRIISKRTLREFWEKHSTAKVPLMLWYENISKQNFDNLVELRQIFPHADSVGNFTVFNIGGNKYRLITYIAINGLVKTFSKSIVVIPSLERNLKTS